jgi:hypothetical protein
MQAGSADHPEGRQYMKFFSAWLREFSQKVDPVVARMAGDSGQQNAYDAPPLEGNIGSIEDNPTFRGLFNCSIGCIM